MTLAAIDIHGYTRIISARALHLEAALARDAEASTVSQVREDALDWDDEDHIVRGCD